MCNKKLIVNPVDIVMKGNKFETKKVTNALICLEDAINQMGNHFYQLGEELLPDFVKDIRGYIDNTPDIIYAVVINNDVEYIGFDIKGNYRDY